MSATIREETLFPFLRHGTREASTIGSWARAAFLPPETFQALLRSLTSEWLEAGTDSVAATAGEAAALAAYRGQEAPAANAWDCRGAHPGNP